MSTDFDAAVAQSLQSDTAQSARVGFALASDTNPDAYAEAQRVARRTGVPVATALNMPAEMKRQARMGEIDFDSLAKTHPATANLLADVEKAKLVHDDVEGLTAIESALYSIGKYEVGGVKALASGAFFRVNEGVGGLLRAAGEVLPDEFSPLARFGADYARFHGKQADAMVPRGDGNLSSGFFSGMESLGMNLVTLPLGLAGKMAPVLTAMGALTGGKSYQQAREQKLDVGTSLAFGTTQGLIEVGTEMIGLPALFSILKPGQLGAKALEFMGKEMAGEQLATVLQDLNEWAVLPENKDKTFGDYIAARPDAAIQTAVATIVGGGGQIALLKGVERMANRGQQAVDLAEPTVELLGKLNELGAANKVLQRDPETFEQFIANAAENGPVSQVFVDANTLMQSGVAEQVAAVSPAVAEQLQTALQTGGQIAIPVEEYAARIAPTEYAQPLIDHLKVEPEGFSRAEAQQYMQSHADELRAEVERVLAEKEGDDTFKASAEAVKTEIRAQLDTAARFTPQVNDAYASMVSNFYAVQAAKLGLAPQELHQRYPLRVVAEAMTGPQFDQPAVAKITGAEIAPVGADIKTLRSAAKDWYNTNLRGTSVVHGETGKAVKFATATKALHSSADPKKLQLFAALRDIVAHGTIEKSEPERDPKRYPNVKAWHWLTATVSLDGAPVKVGVMLREDNQGNFYYNHNLAPEKAKALQSPELTDPNNESGGGTEEGKTFAQSLAPAADDINLRILADGRELNQAAYHGSPFRFDKFSLDHIGNGEGNQAFGWGLYFAGKKAIAEFYRQGLSDFSLQVDGKEYDNDNPAHRAASSKYEAEKNGWDMQDVIDRIKRSIDDLESRGKQWADEEATMQRKTVELLESGAKLPKYEEVSTGQLYEVDIPEDDRLLLWDKPLDKQPAAVKKILKDSGLWKELKANLSDYSSPMRTRGGLKGENIYAYLEWKLGSDKAASLRLNELGIPGLRYPEGTISGGGKGGHNYVIFDDEAVKILNAYYQANGEQNRGAFNPATLQISLLKAADLSTFLHESGHFFLEVQADIVAQLQQQATMFGTDALKPGEQQMLADMQALLDWFGVKDLNEWHALDFEEKRAYHEQFARGFEAYLFEGKAPSIELQGLFQRFRAWLLNVYRDLKALNVELNDQVRGVFDRMLASNEQIQLAEQGRSMMPLFTSADQAGMTPEEFAAYQSLGIEATAEAIDDLQAKGLRDMRWIHNARGRLIKQLQKEAAAQRAEVQMDVRREVMSQPIYRAWQFLTGKLTAEDKVENPKPPKTDPNVLDETMDSLFVAIAKLGGLNKAETLGTWGVDPADKPQSGVFGKPVWRVDGGLSLDGMREALAQYGYTYDTLADFEAAFDSELRGSPVYSSNYAPEQFQNVRPGDQIANPAALTAGRLDLGALDDMGLPAELVNHLKALRMTAKEGLHPDLVAEMFGFSSGDELVRRIAASDDPKTEIEGLTDAAMLERYGELSSPDAIERAADKAIHNEARARFVSTEANALAKATGQRKVLASAAREFARAMIDRLKVRAVRPGQYASAEVRAAKAAEKASKAGDLATAAAEKRNQLIQNYATRAAYDAQDEVNKGLRYLKKFEGDVKGLDADYADQVGALLERFDLRKGQSLKAIDKRATLAEWLKTQREAGLEPDIPADLENEAYRKSFKDMTVEEFRGLVDSVKQIEHLGRLKHKLLTAKDQRAYEAIRDDIVASIRANSQDREADARTPTTNMGRALQGLKRFWASHIKAATWARVMDGGKDGGPMWEYFVRAANERGDMETTMRAEATAKLSEILAPIFALGKMGGKGQFFAGLNRSLNREARLAIALNTGNAGNLQRLLGGEGWNEAQILPVLQSLTAAEWRAVQAVWDHFESYRPQIAEKERRIYGKEPAWVDPVPFTIKTADGQEVSLRGGYYPIKYDPAASQRAEEHADAEGAQRQLRGAYTTATTRRSFTKARVEEITGRPLLYTLSGLYSGVNDVIHDLAWHEWLIDTNRLLRSQSIDAAIREHYGPEAKQQFKTWAADIAEGDKGADAAVDMALSRLRQGISASGLGFNAMSAAIQITGFNQSIVRIGATWVGRGVVKYLANPVGLTRQVNEMSDFMANRSRTRFRELNELRNRVQDQSAFREFIGQYAYFMMMRMQQIVDVPTWWGAYEKAIAEGNDETRARDLADQAVIDAQGGGQTKDLSAIERGGPAQRLFTVFYSFMNTAFNLGAAQTMSADTPAKKAKLAVDYLMLYTVPAVLGYAIKAALTPGDSGDDDPDKIAKKLLAAQIDYLMGLMVVVREFGEAAKTLTGANDIGRDYTGPAGLRLVSDMVALSKQAAQGEFDTAFRKAAVNVIGDTMGLPSAQINRTITGTEALAEGETDNPAAVVFGFQKPR